MNYELENRRGEVTRQLWAISLLIVSSAACSEPYAPEVASVVNSTKSVVMAQASQLGAVANLPFAQGRSFTSLDDYLAFRKSRGAYDLP